MLTGLNNTSKTYVAHAIYGLGRVVGSVLSQALVDQVFVSITRDPGAGGGDQQLEVDLVELTREHLPFALRHTGDNYGRRLGEVFASDPSFAAQATTQVNLTEAEQDDLVRGLLALDYVGPVRDQDVMVEKRAGSSKVVLTRTPKPEVTPTANSAGSAPLPLRQVATIFVSSWMFAGLFGSYKEAYILTAERNAIQLFSRELSSKRSDLVDSLLQATANASPSQLGSPAEPLELLRKGARRYPLAIRDSLRIANDLAEAQRNESKDFARIADDLEAQLLQGSIHVSDQGEMLFRPSKSGTTLDLHLASSSVKSLASLSFYLRHIARKGHFLIIDEPELNLHPHNQRLLARLLARLARSGIKVLISTHSDYIIRELNNLLMLSADKDGQLREKYGYDEGETLSPDRVGAYLCDGAHAHPIPIEPAGIGVAAIDKEVRELNRSSRDIYFSLFDRDEA